MMGATNNTSERDASIEVERKESSEGVPEPKSSYYYDDSTGYEIYEREDDSDRGDSTVDEDS